MRKPRIKIIPSGYKSRPWLFVVKWPGNHFRNSEWWNFDDALIAARVKEPVALAQKESAPNET